MNIVLISSSLGLAAFVLLVAAFKEDSKVSVTVWPPGTEVFLGECVLLWCAVESDATLAWNYRFFQNEPRATQMTKKPRHLLSGGTYSITAVTREDAGRYWCQAERSDSNATVALFSRPVTLNVSELPPPPLTLTPSARHMFVGETFTLQCPETLTNSSAWVLRQTWTSHLMRTADSKTNACSTLGSVVSPGRSSTCVVSAARGHSGLYWCEGAEGRSNAVHITVTSGPVIMRTPAFSVPHGSNVVLACRFRKGNHTRSTFFRNGVETSTNSSPGPGAELKLTIENVTDAHEGFYKCASQDGKLESPQSWLSVRSNLLSADVSAGSSSGSWIWVVVSCVLMILIPLAILLIHHFRYKIFYTRSCWTVSGEETPAAVLPATKQDVTEVQWDLSWMEMSNLLYPST
ncbi:high affinity immunoglobulin gamma Fc receptor I-like isoform X1 [Phycodurus eques]|uniref:high affinity immunoglobulin gamma Fc receptor I-like isoform X1 n=2 Tax=Phycodurus eques TaxID=693459 RepID=UPI002ACEFA34|nr:high affinity immunoglobulin gamma Fc receptor I-like isoform X1 [Phycodurus eques]XP_061539906.1 high affinity immunoglobulin gamma Fc receptor I-like isoform X1 [Phycodurus eques]